MRIVMLEIGDRLSFQLNDHWPRFNAFHGFDDMLSILLRIPVPPFRYMRLGEPLAQHRDIPGLDIAEMIAGSVVSHRCPAFRR